MYLIATDRVHPDHMTCNLTGEIAFRPLKSLWLFTNITGLAIAAFYFCDILAILWCLGLTAITICMGHSVGMHRLLIHRSFHTYKLIEYILVWLGALVGMAGPIGMIRAHDMRDWHQRQVDCPQHPAHNTGFWRDAWWQLCCEFQLRNSPDILIEPEVNEDILYRLLERSWMLQQLPIALISYAIGGWAWVLWGCCARISISLIGHWMIGHYAHKQGQQTWRIAGLSVQGFNINGFGLLTFGEAWHGNHHAFPHSAKLGLDDGQSDLGFQFIRLLEKSGLAWGIQLPNSKPNRTGLERLTP
ncbi:delta-9 desaturase [Amylibacter marinus]|uniref:Delta-9 desaturase n=1 Tax=Amylibacter marinus TaxID=1475483 RepID=A0ABQ5VSA8_9RHOB|nr:acyl-CoA desaturase [Amylibacter marinus]GLQ34313.1 delta-9 desaturase [Amylibacter marinus]